MADITSRDIVLALPNNLVGFVPITSISDKLTAKIEKLVQEQDSSSADGSESEDFEDVDLNQMFYVGQYLRAYVTSAAEDGLTSGATKKRIELSINPNLVNRGLSKSTLVVNGTVQASVISNEDHGLIMDLGMEEQQLKAFLPSSELGQQIEHANVQEGSVFLCLISRIDSSGRVVALSLDQQQSGKSKKLSYVSEAPTIDIFLPGTAVEMLITDTTPTTIIGKIMGMVDATADIIHSGAANTGADISEKYKVGSKVKARIICTFPEADPKKVGVSLLGHITSLAPQTSGKGKEKKAPSETLPLSSFVEEAEVIRVEPLGGLYLDVGIQGVAGFAHISRLTDGKKIERLSDDSGPHKLGSKHRARIVGYNAIDGLFQVSLEQSVLDQPFLRVQDINIGQIVKGKIHKLIIDKKGSTSVLVHLSEGITGLVSETHLADVRLQHPERKFREAASVTARVLSIDEEKRHVLLTLKKSLVNSEVEPWMDYSSISESDKGPGTLVDIKPSGAVVRFYGDVKAWLPAAEMSEAFIEDATRHFQRGQVVGVRVISIDRKDKRMLVSCKDPLALDPDKEAVFKSLNIGDIVRGTVIGLSTESITTDLGHGVKGVLRIGHLTDGSEKKDKSTMAKLRVGGPIEEVVVIDKHYKSRTVTLSNKPSLRKDAQGQTLITQFQDVRAGETVHGFVRGILPDKVFVEFGGGVVGLLFHSQLPDELKQAPNFGFRKDQSITVRVAHVDVGQARFWLSMRSEADVSATSTTQQASGEATVNAVDQKVKSTADLSFGSETSVRIKSIKSTQINVQVADNVQGRISIAEVFNDWDEIAEKKHALAQFKPKDILIVRVLGMHDARNHRFLPITHRQGRVPIFELTAKKGKLESESDLLALDKITEGSSYIAFINNIAERYVWVNLSANVRGRIELFDLSDDISLLSNVEENFPVGSALKVRVKSVDPSTGRLDLTAASTLSAKSLELKDLKPGLRLPARVTKTNESSIVVQINENIAGPVHVEQLADDYDKAKPKEFKLGEIIRVCVLDVDAPNKRISLSARPSRVLSPSLPVKDPEITELSQLKVHQVVRGFVKRVADNGVYIRLGHNVDAFVRISNLSDSFIKDWKSAFQVDQLVTGKIIAVNPGTKNPQMALKQSVVEGTYVQLLEFGDMEVGQIITAKVRKVESYGVFLVVDNSHNVSGLCHISEMADKRVEDVKALYKEGDNVKAKILKVEPEKRRISFGLKYSYVKGEQDENESEDSEAEEDEISASDVSGIDIDDEDVDTRSIKSAEGNGGVEIQEDDDDEIKSEGQPSHKTPTAGLSTSGFDWTGATLDFDDQKVESDSSSDEEASKKKRKHKKATIKEDRTGDLDAYGPQSVADYERLLLGQPNSAELWIRYMIFQRELNEVDKARQIARRGLATINLREEKEKLDVWTALLHLENDFGSDDLVEETFKEACQYNDSREVHERMIKIYISSSKLDVSVVTSYNCPHSANKPIESRYTIPKYDQD